MFSPKPEGEQRRLLCEMSLHDRYFIASTLLIDIARDPFEPSTTLQHYTTIVPATPPSAPMKSFNSKAI
jgi:hypothetical protein